MGIFDFFKDKGKEVESTSSQDTATAIQTMLETVMSGQIENLSVNVDDDGRVTLGGTASDAAVREKAILLAGNVKGVSSVSDDALDVAAPEVPEPVFYTVQKGDSLSKIAKAHYGDAMKWKALFEANQEVIEDPDLIYPGQQIRIPDLAPMSK